MGVQKFRSYEAAERALLEEGWKRPLDVRSASRFLRSVWRLAGGKSGYRPGLYRFSTFSEAGDFDMRRMIERAGQRKKH